jgi:alpha-tubulin suppressor-like RCC1 family protein
MNWSFVSRRQCCGAIKTDSTLWAWAGNNGGQNGQNDSGSGNSLNRSSPVQIGGAGWSKIATSGSAMAAIKTDNTLWLWGANNQGQLGFNNRIDRSSPVQLGSDSWSQVSTGGHTLAIEK